MVWWTVWPIPQSFHILPAHPWSWWYPSGITIVQRAGSRLGYLMVMAIIWVPLAGKMILTLVLFKRLSLLMIFRI